MTDGADDLVEVFLKDTPMNRLGLPEKVSKSVYLLESDLSSYVNGEELVVDEGYLSR